MSLEVDCSMSVWNGHFNSDTRRTDSEYGTRFTTDLNSAEEGEEEACEIRSL